MWEVVRLRHLRLDLAARPRTGLGLLGLLVVGFSGCLRDGEGSGQAGDEQARDTRCATAHDRRATALTAASVGRPFLGARSSRLSSSGAAASGRLAGWPVVEWREDTTALLR